jgi:iron complex transport system ATP-binding protein
LYALLRRLADEGKAILVVLHQIEDALRSADRVLLMDHGQGVAYGPAAHVLTPDLIRKIYGVTMVAGEGYGFHLADAAEVPCA